MRARFRLVLLLAVAPLACAACQQDLPGIDIRIVDNKDPACAVGSVENPIKPLLAAGDVLRLSIRARGKDGAPVATNYMTVPPSLGICDAIVSDPRQPFSVKIPEGGSVDLFGELFAPDGTGKFTRVASGAQLGLGFVGPVATQAHPTLRLYYAEQAHCLPEKPTALLAKQRAFHTATLLPGQGDVLLLGGLRVNSDTTKEDQPADQDESYFASDAVEVYDARTAQFAAVTGTLARPRAFHKVALVRQSGSQYTFLLMGGITAAQGTAVVHSAAGDLRNVPGGFRYTPTAAANAAPPEMIVYDASTHTLTAGEMADSSLVMQSAAFEAGAPLAEGGMVYAGGVLQPGSAAAPMDQVAAGTTRDGKFKMSMSLPAGRAGAGLVTLPSAPGMMSQQALLLGGATGVQMAMGGPVPEPPFVSIELTRLAFRQQTASAAFPSYFLPTVTLLDTSPDSTSWRMLVSGGLEIDGSKNALQPPPRTLHVVTWQPNVDMLTVDAVQGSAGVSVADTCMMTVANRYRPTAFNAATLLAPADPAVAADRVLVTGGTARTMLSGCTDCPDSDATSLSCVLGQAVIVSVPATGAGVVSPASSALLIPRFGHSQTQLLDGNVLVAGGFTRRAAAGATATYGVRQAELWNPARKVAPTGVSTRSGLPVSDPDDPLSADLRAATPIALVREPGLPAHSAGDNTPKLLCAGLTK